MEFAEPNIYIETKVNKQNEKWKERGREGEF